MRSYIKEEILLDDINESMFNTRMSKTYLKDD